MPGGEESQRKEEEEEEEAKKQHNPMLRFSTMLYRWLYIATVTAGSVAPELRATDLPDIEPFFTQNYKEMFHEQCVLY